MLLAGKTHKTAELEDGHCSTDVELAGQAEGSSFDVGRQVAHRGLEMLRVEEGHSPEAVEGDEVVEGVDGHESSRNAADDEDLSLEGMRVFDKLEHTY